LDVDLVGPGGELVSPDGVEVAASTAVGFGAGVDLDQGGVVVLGDRDLREPGGDGGVDVPASAFGAGA
jgi:hypothetical protein